MAAHQFGILSTFDHTVHSWKTYKSRLAQWFIANDVTAASDVTGSKRRAILLSALTDGTYKLASDLALPKELQEVPYEDILLLLDSHFTPKRSGFGERCKFYAASQQAGETPTQWAARLRGLTAHCGFSNVEEALRDRFVMAMLPGRERDKLFAQDLTELTLAKAIELAETLRSARAEAAATVHLAGQQEQQLYKIDPATKKSAVSVDKCSVCGRSNHTSAKCRFAKYKCKKCHVTGHLQRMCKKTNYIATTSDVDEDDDGRLFKISCINGEPMTEIVTILGVELKFEIDSGSAVTVISRTVYNKYFSTVPLSPTKKQLYTYVGNKITCAGVTRLPVTYSGQTQELNIYVVNNGTGPPLLGRDFIASFKLELLPCMYLDKTDDMFKQLQSQFPRVFSDKLGAFNKYKVKLKIKPGSQPVFFKARPIAFALKDKINNEIDRLVQLGVLKPVEHAEYASPIVPVLKRNGTVRLCVDYSVSINKQLIVEQYPLPTVHELFSRLHGGLQFSKLDLSMAYNQFLLDEDSQKLTCINTHRGLYKYTRMVFGLSSAPSIFQRAMECVLSDMDGVLCLLDDVLITGPTRDVHLQRLKAVLERLQDAGLVLQKEKCEFFKNEIDYLGYKINKHGLMKSPEKVKAIVEAPVPTNVGKLQSFLGLVNYYRNFVKNASGILSPLYDLLKKGIKWNWSELHNKSFSKIKEILASDQVLTHFNHNAKLILTVDASPTGLGAVLSQLESDGSERPISFASRTLNAAEKNYAQIQKEATAIIFGIRRFHQYLYARSDPFVLRTDHKPLISIFGPYKGIPEVSANRLQRYALFLSGYNYTIEYVRSNNNCADYLSRASLPEVQQSDSTNSKQLIASASGGGGAAAAIGTLQDDSYELPPSLERAAYINFVVDGSLPVTLTELREQTSKDAILKAVIKYVLNGWPKKITDIKLKPYWCCKLELSFEDGCLMRGHKVILPGNLRHKVMLELHKSHLGIVKTKATARARVWFPGIDVALEKMIGSCYVCTQLRPSPPRAPLSPWKYPPSPFVRIHIDFLGPIHGHTFLVVVDAHSKWVEVYDMTNTSTSVAVIDKLYDFMSRFGIPQTIVSDNGTAFVSQEFKKFCNSNGILHVTSPSYHPASNGQAESYVKIVKRGIKSCILSNSNVRESRLNLLKYLFDYRNSIHSTTGLSPAQLVFGKNLRSRLDLLNPKLNTASSSSNIPNVVKNKQCSQIESYGGKNRETYNIGDNVLYKNNVMNKNCVWKRGTIVKRIGKVMYLVKDFHSLIEHRKHKNQLVLYKGINVDEETFWDCDSDVQVPVQQDNNSTSPESMGPSIPVVGESDTVTESEQTVTTTQNTNSLPQPSSSPVMETAKQSTSRNEDAEEFHEALSESNHPPQIKEQQIQRYNPLSRTLLRKIPRVDYKD